MSKRRSGSKRIPRDAYQTREEWVTFALVKYLPRIKSVWECAAGKGFMARALLKCKLSVYSTDIMTGTNFLTTSRPRNCDAIITNPPYSDADKFIEHALWMMNAHKQIKLVAMLLPIDFDSAKTRRHLFGDCRTFSHKIVLTRRIVWFKLKKVWNKKKKKWEKHGPSENHAWFVWTRKTEGLPKIIHYYE